MEINSLLLDLAQPGKGKYLKSAGVRKNRTVPGHEFVKSANFADQLVSCADVQVVGV